MRSSAAALIGLLLAMGCDRTSPTAPAETDPSLGRHDITRIDERTGEFELRGLEGCFGELVIVRGTLRYKEHTVKVWDVHNGYKMVRNFRGHTGVVASLTFASCPDGLRLVSGSRDHTVKVWDVTPLGEVPER